jgi:CheY-like chemotaxis protein
MLQALGYRTIVARDGLEAVELFKAHRFQIDLVVMDVVMPQLNGPDAYSKMVELRSDIKAIFTTGYTSEAASLMSLLEKGAAVLQKPYGLTALSQTIRTTLGRDLPTLGIR